MHGWRRGAPVTGGCESAVVEQPGVFPATLLQAQDKATGGVLLPDEQVRPVAPGELGLQLL